MSNITRLNQNLNQALANRDQVRAGHAATAILRHYNVNSNQLTVYTKISHALKIRQLRNHPVFRAMVNRPNLLKNVLRA